MSILNIKRIFLLLFFLTIFSFYFFNIDYFFTLQFLKENNFLLIEYVNQNFFSSILFFYLLFLILIFFFLPLTSVMVIFSSYLFGTLITIFLSILIVTLGGVSNVFLLNKITFNKIFVKAEELSKKIKNKIEKNELQYCILLRFVPMPFIIQNAILVLLKISKIKFIISTSLGIAPYIVIYSLAGFKLKELINLNNEIKMENIINYENFFILIFLIFLIFLSMYFKKKIN